VIIVNWHSDPTLREFIPKTARRMLAVAADIGETIELADGTKPLRCHWDAHGVASSL
jgi:hypothetical protein